MRLALAIPWLLVLPTAVDDSVPREQDEELAELLLTTDDLPVGWSVAFTGLDGVRGSGDGAGEELDPCSSSAPLSLIDLEHDRAAGVMFSYEGDRDSEGLSLDLMIHLIVETGEDDAVAFVDEFRGLIEDCQERLRDHPEEGSAEHLDLPDLGDDAFGMIAVGPPDGMFQFAAGFVAVAVDDLVVLLLGVDGGADSELLVETAVVAADRADD